MLKKTLIFVVFAFFALPASAQLILYDDEGRIEEIRPTGGSAVLRECLISVAAREGFECPDAGGGFLSRSTASWFTHEPDPFAFFNMLTIGTLSERAKTQALLDHMGRDTDTSHLDDTTTIACVSCSFVASFVFALLTFSLVVFEFFQRFFLTLTPILIVIWLAYRASSLFLHGGEKGDQFVRDFAKKIAAFFVAFLIVITPSSAGDPFFWKTVGPDLLELGVGMNAGLRNHMMDELAATWGGEGDPSLDRMSSLGCEDVPEQMAEFQGQRYAESVAPVVVATCLVERFSAVGIGLGLVSTYINFNSMSTAFEWSFRGLGDRIGDLFFGFFSSLMAISVIVMFAISAIWLIFVFLDTVVKIFITAALFPIFAAAILFNPTRAIAMKGGQALIASLVSLVSLSLVMILGFFLLMMIPDVYMMTFERYNAFTARGTEHLLQPLQTQSVIGRFGEMVFRANIHPNSRDAETAALYIPFHFATPWFMHMIFVALCIRGLGKKIIKVIDDQFATTGGSALADSAMAMMKNSARLSARGSMLAGSGSVAIGSGLVNHTIPKGLGLVHRVTDRKWMKKNQEEWFRYEDDQKKKNPFPKNRR